jgi:hypothetical protein
MQPVYHKRGMHVWGLAYLFGYVGCIYLANWLIVTFGIIPVGFGLYAPAGVLAAGACLTLRDLTQEALGRWWCVGAIIGGAVLSFALGDGRIAVASGIAFLVSELCDFAVYQPLREQRWLLAVGMSNTVGAVVDSVLFLSLAFGSLAFLAGQVVGKAWMTALAMVLLWAVRRQRAVSERAYQ